MVTLAQFREITEDLPGDFEIRIEACFTPEGNKTAPCFEMMYSKGTKEVVLLPEGGKPLQNHHNKGEEPSKRIGITGSTDLPVIQSQSRRSTHKEGQRKQAFTKKSE